MPSVELGDAATWVGVLVSLVASAAAFGVAMASRRHAQRSADAAERSAGAAEEQVTMAKEEAQRYRIPWEIEQVGETRYLLVNKGEETEYYVSVEADFILDSPVQKAEVGPTEAIAFIQARAYGDKDKEITVTWYRNADREGEPMVWRHPPL